MKKTIYLSLLAGCLTILSACDGSEYDLENLVPEEYHKILYVNNSGKQDLTLFNTNENNTYTFSVIKSGSNPNQTASANIAILTQEEVDSQYSQLEGVNYKVIGENTYSLDVNSVAFSTADRYKLVNISLNPQEVKKAMESDPTAVWVLPLHVISEVDSINANKNELFLQLKGVITPTIGFTNSSVNVKTHTYGLVSTITENIPFKLDTDNKWDIECEFTVDKEYIDAYNTKNKTTFQMLPEDAYSLAKSMILPTGTTSTNLAITVQGNQLEPGDYMLPVRFSSISQFEISSTNAIYPMAIRIMGEQLDRTGWKAEANTEETDGEGPVNGRVGCLLDGDITTFWHSKWKGGSHDLPHELIIDAQKEYTFTQFALTHRGDHYYVKAGEFYVSSDKENWKKAGTFLMKQENGSQVFSIDSTKGRYFKVLITESNHGNDSAMAEIYAYGLK